MSFRLSLIIAALLGVGAFFTCYDLAYFLGLPAVWGRMQDDTRIHIIGSLYFLREGWHWPLGHIAALGFPEGGNIIFTDSLPLFALPLKVLVKALGVPPTFEYFGMWMALCYVLQPVAMVLLLRAAGVRGVPLLAGALLALAVPEWILRADYGHETLCAHFLLIFALIVYLRGPALAPWRTFAALAALVTIALLVHGYLFAMVMGLSLAIWARAVGARAMKASTALGQAVGLSLLAAGVMIAVGHIGTHSLPPTDYGFGLFSMNLLSPFDPATSALLGMGPIFDPTGGQYEGYNYLGLGLGALLLLALATSPLRIGRLVRRHAVLCAILAAFTFYALSNRIFLGSHLLVELPIPPQLRYLTEQFRASGRFFWPVTYVLIAGAVVVTARRFPPRAAAALLTVAALLQAADASALLLKVHGNRTQERPHLIPWPAWESLLVRHHALYVYPSFTCTRVELRFALLELQLRAALLGLPSSSAATARPVRDCGRENAALLQDTPRRDALTVFQGPAARVEAVRSYFHDVGTCRQSGLGLVCSAHWAPEDDAAFTPLAPVMYKPGTRLDFRGEGTASPFLGTGWSGAEMDGRWTEGMASDLILDLGRRPDADLQLAVETAPYLAPPKLTDRTVVVTGNGVTLATWHFTDGRRGTWTARLPASAVYPDGLVVIRLRQDRVPSPSELAMGAEPRHLGLKLTAAALQ